MTLSEGKPNKSYKVTSISAEEEGMKDFLFTLGCYPGESVTIISRLASNLIVNIKDARYSIDSELARAIVI
mgnify:CR=1 FL=1|jgi:ferrous iron transport protein A